MEKSLLWWRGTLQKLAKPVSEAMGEDDVEVEETDSRGFRCYEESGEKMHRIWVREPKRLD